MKSRLVPIGILVSAVFTLAVVAGLTHAQGPGPQGRRTSQAPPVGTAFTYQGQLEGGGQPVNGNCSMAFRLYDQATEGHELGAITPTVPISGGLFTVSLDYGSGAFTGDARWLAIRVRCPGDIGYTDLGRQVLTPAPYALALPGLWTQQNDTSPNLVGGYSSNSVTGGVVGATIGGGGASENTNRVTDNYGTVAGGFGNWAGNSTGTTGDGAYATVGGGYHNGASGWAATVSGGDTNSASKYGAAVGGGYTNFATAEAATIGGGYGNWATNDYTTIGGGGGNMASGRYATVGGGIGNHSTSSQATVAGGSQNTASNFYSTIPGGYEAAATHYGEMAYASGNFTTTGDAQTSLYVLRRTTTDSSPTELLLDGDYLASERLMLASGRVVAFDVLVVVGEVSGSNSAGYRIVGVIENVGGTTALVGTPSKIVLGEDDPNWEADVVADDTHDALVVQATGAAATTIRWVAVVRTVEVAR